MVYWLVCHGHSSQVSNARDYPLKDLPGLDEAWSVAKKHKKVKDFLSEVRCGVRGVEYEDGAIRLPYRRHPDLGLLQDGLSLMHALELLDFPFPDLGSMWSYASGGSAAGSWFRRSSHRSVPCQTGQLLSRKAGHAVCGPRVSNAHRCDVRRVNLLLERTECHQPV